MSNNDIDYREDAVVVGMREIGDDDIEREFLIEWTMYSHDLTREEAEEGIQKALMSGECFETTKVIINPI